MKKAWGMMLAGVLLAGWGCGPKQHGIKGQVTLDGQLVGPGSIVFLPEEGTISRKASAAILDGQYEVPTEHGPLAGFFRVEISWMEKTGKQIPGVDPGTMIPETREIMPAQYNSASTLKVEVKPGENVFDFHLKSE
jgi:hypothetical protein